MSITSSAIPGTDSSDVVGSRLLAGGLVLLGAALFSSLRVGYETGLVDAAPYGTLSSVLVVGGIGVGAITAGVLGYLGVNAVEAIVVSVSPVLGLSVGSIATAALGLGGFDSSPLALVAILVVASAAFGGVAWFVGHVVS